MTNDVIILGLGAMGSAAAYHLAQRGKKVLGIEQFASPHDQGSSHGGSRIIRQAYWESPDYVPLVLRAYELWRRLEKDTNRRLMQTTGIAVMGSEIGELASHTIAAANEHSIPIEVLRHEELRRRFPQFVLNRGEIAVYEPGAGYLIPEDCIRAHLQLATRYGADLQFNEKVLSWSVHDDHVEVQTSNGRYEAGQLVIAAGPWANESLREVFPLRVTRQVMAWFQPRAGLSAFLPERFPIYIAEDPEGSEPVYGFPAIDGPDGGMKAAVHGSDVVCTPENVDRAVHDADAERIMRLLRTRIPGMAGEMIRAKTCLYTMSPDEHFIIGAHPGGPLCTVACGFSGHGFKFASVVGEILADMALEGSTAHAISLFSPGRFEVPWGVE